MLMIKDLTASKELDSKAMAGVHGGTDVTLDNETAVVNQAFAFLFDQANGGANAAGHSFGGANYGIVYAPIDQTLEQWNKIDDTRDNGRTTV